MQRMQPLQHALDRPKEMAVFKLIAALFCRLGDEVTYLLNADSHGT